MVGLGGGVKGRGALGVGGFVVGEEAWKVDVGALGADVGAVGLGGGGMGREVGRVVGGFVVGVEGRVAGVGRGFVGGVGVRRIVGRNLISADQKSSSSSPSS